MSEITAETMLEIWGLRLSGGSLKNPLLSSSGGKTGADDEAAIVAYVERIPSFDVAKPILWHRYVENRPVKEFQICRPGERLEAAVARLGWWMLYDLAPDAMRWSVFEGFKWRLDRELRRRPFIAPSERAGRIIDPDQGPVTKAEARQIEGKE